jgi:MFS family permease
MAAVQAGRPAAAAVADHAEPSPFRSGRFAIFAAGNTANNIGEGVYATALPLLAFERTHSFTVLALLTGAVPAALVLAPVLGVAADRWGPRVLVVPGLLVQAAAAAVLILLLRGDAATAALFGCAFMLAVGGAAYRTGWMTGIPGMFPDFPVRARGSLNSLFFATALLGPAIVAAALPWIGYQGMLWLNLATFFAPIAVWAAGIHPPARARAERGTHGGNWRLRDGWLAISGDRRLRRMLAAQVAVAIAGGAGLSALVVYHLGHGWGLTGRSAATALTVMNAGLLLGNLLVAQRKRFYPHSALRRGMVAQTLCLALLAVPWWPVFIAALFVGAVGQGAVLSAAVMMRIKFLAADVLGRASGLLWLITGAAALLSPLVTTLFSDVFGTRGAFIALAGVCSVGLGWLRGGAHDQAALAPADRGLADASAA